MIEIYLISAMLLLHLFFKTDRTKTYCGIFAFSGKRDLSEAQMKIILWKIHILGLYNESRGVHGCGLYIGNEIYKGVNTTKKYSEFIACNEFDLNYESGNKIILGHCRQASVGDHSEKNTHPFLAIHKTKKENQIVGAHNGTIPNIWTLCTKYQISHTDIHSDSKALYEIIVNKGTKVLSEYEGGAALLWAEKDKNKMFAFHGASKAFVSSVEMKEERPLFYLKTKEGIFFSSLEESLFSISEGNDLPMMLEHNKVFEIVDGEFTETIEIDRSQINKFFTYNTTSNFNLPTFPQTTIPFEENKRTEFPKNSPYIWKEKPFTTQNKIVFCNGRFYLHGELCTGQLKLSPKGEVVDHGTNSIYYFYRGVMLKSGVYFQFINDNNNALDVRYGLNFAKAISKYSVYPVINLPKEAKNITVAEGKYNWWINEILANFSFTPSFSPRHYVIDGGNLIKVSSSKHDEKNKDQLFYPTYEKSFEAKQLFFEKETNPLKIITSEAPQVNKKGALNTIYMSRVDCVKELTQNEYDALCLMGEEYLLETSRNIPTTNEITFYVHGLIDLAVQQFCSIYEVLTTEEKNNLESHLKTLNEEESETQTHLKEMTEYKLLDVIDTLEILNDLSEDLEIIDTEFAQNASFVIKALILEAQKKIEKLAEDNKSDVVLAELKTSKLTN